MIVGCILISLLFTYTDYKGYYKISVITKSCATLSISILANICFINNPSNPSNYFILVLLAIIFGLVGDFFLALDNLCNETKTMFIMGLIAFLIGHVFYILAFNFINPISIFDFIFSILFLGIAYLAYKKTKLELGNLKMGVFLYAMVISFMLGKATSILLLSQRNLLEIVIFVGALLFVLSDTALSFSIFGKENKKKLSVLCHILYFPAQIILALSVLLY
ncbi:MAG: lysoplasmalogenase [Terrisporobacter sp.]|uniref:lysoplasmalogenase n=1 Tax=Terrisporobacter sp. TaxID=1965305 RepID=UPI002FC656AC